MNPTSSSRAVDQSYHQELNAARKAFKANQTLETTRRFRDVVEKAIRITQESGTNLVNTCRTLISEYPALTQRDPNDKVQKTGRIHFHKELSIAKTKYEGHKSFLTARKYKIAMDKAIKVAQIKFAAHSKLRTKLLAYENSIIKAQVEAGPQPEKNPLSASDEIAVSLLAGLKSLPVVETKAVKKAKAEVIDLLSSADDKISSSASDEDFAPSSSDEEKEIKIDAEEVKKSRAERKVSFKATKGDPHNKSDLKKDSIDERSLPIRKRKLDQDSQKSKHESPPKKARKD